MYQNTRQRVSFSIEIETCNGSTKDVGCKDELVVKEVLKYLDFTFYYMVEISELGSTKNIVIGKKPTVVYDVYHS